MKILEIKKGAIYWVLIDGVPTQCYCHGITKKDTVVLNRGKQPFSLSEIYCSLVDLLHSLRKKANFIEDRD